MTSGTRRLPQAGLALLIGLAAMIGGCDRQPAASSAAKVDASAGIDAAKPVDVAMAPAAVAAPQPAPGLDGVWRVIGVAVDADAPTAFATDDPALMGSEITINDSALAWTRKASADFTADDVCNGPRAEDVAAASPAEFAAAMARFGAGEKPGGVVHMVCTKGGNWGPEADDGARMLRLGNNRLVMGWYDGVVLLLERAAA